MGAEKEFVEGHIWKSSIRGFPAWRLCRPIILDSLVVNF